MYLDDFDPTQRTAIDVETISWNDNRGGLLPYSGDRVCGIAIVQHGKQAYFPVRHRTDIQSCLPFDEFFAEMREFAVRCTNEVANVNLKFDLHSLAQDGVEFPNAKLRELQVLARLVDNNIDKKEKGKKVRKPFSLEELCARFNKDHKKNAYSIKDWLVKNKTQDYGAIPIPLISRYGIDDTLAAFELWHTLEAQLPEISKWVWDNEAEFLRAAFECERAGMELNPTFFNACAYLYTAEQCKLLDRMGEFWTKLLKSDKPVEFNPGSYKQKNRYFELRGIDPVHYNFNEDDEGNEIQTPSWNKDAIALVIDEGGIGDDICRYNEIQTNLGTFAKGWIDKLSKDGKLHASILTHGTKSGRSSSKPNIQNPPDWVWQGIVIPEDCVGLNFDYSQIQYRCFAHYAEDPGIDAAYAANPKTDYHQLLADRMELSDFRDPIKTQNFSFLFGMGKAKTVRKIAKLLYDVKQKFVKDGKAEKYDEILARLRYKYSVVSLEDIAMAFYDDYRKMVPAARILTGKVKEALRLRGFIRNFFGRRYFMEEEKAYKGMNYLCQGFEADYVKERLAFIHNHECAKDYGAKMIDYVHDADYTIVKRKFAVEWYDFVNQHATKQPEAFGIKFRIPLFIDWKLSIGNFGNANKIKSREDLVKCLTT